MSTNKTQNYQLHGWAFGDEFPRGELNANFTKLDTALKAEETARAAAAQNEAAARAAAVATLNTAIGKKAEIVVGTYTGTGASGTRTISLGFTPRAALVLAPFGGGQNGDNSFGSLTVTGAPATSNNSLVCQVTTEGFEVNQGYRSAMNVKDYIYRYLAVK